MAAITIYIMAEESLQYDGRTLTVGDICSIFCLNREIMDFVKRIPVPDTAHPKEQREILSVIALTGQVLEALQRYAPEQQFVCQHLGAQQVILEVQKQSAENKIMTFLKVAFVSLIVFTGAAFTIMTYDQDVDVTGVFARIYSWLLGEVPSQPGLLEAGYALGVAIGVLLFFNPFTASKKRKEPSPIEIEMEKYESDIQDTIVKMHQRESGGR